MSQENVERVRRGYERFNATGRPPLGELTPDFVYTGPDNMLGGGVVHGRDAYAAEARKFTDTFDEFRAEPEEIFDHGERVVVFLRFCGRAHSSGIPVNVPLAHVWTFRGDKAAALDVYLDRAEALETVGLRE
jgi:ketosteroid isomerase-like protein